jgi:hypothetical protein
MRTCRLVECVAVDQLNASGSMIKCQVEVGEQLCGWRLRVYAEACRDLCSEVDLGRGHDAAPGCQVHSVYSASDIMSGGGPAVVAAGFLDCPGDGAVAVDDGRSGEDCGAVAEPERCHRGWPSSSNRCLIAPVSSAAWRRSATMSSTCDGLAGGRIAVLGRMVLASTASS